ncbi:MAG: GAF domain-containing protein [Actinomycetota bacterium]
MVTSSAPLQKTTAPPPPTGNPSGGEGAGVLESVALALNSTLELSEVLRVLAGITLDAAEADRCSIFLMEDHKLVPTAAIGRVVNEDLWSAFQAMGDIELDELPGAMDLLYLGEPVPIVDASSSRFIPEGWLSRFTLRSLVIVPLLVAEEPCGVMAVDYQAPQTFEPERLRLLEAIGAYAAVAVRNARLFEATRRRSELQEALARAATQLISPLPRREVASRLLDACLSIVDADVCAIGLLDADDKNLEAIATRGIRHMRTPIPVADIPLHIVATMQDNWDAEEPIELGESRHVAEFLGISGEPEISYLIVPLKAEHHLRGGILLGTRKHLRLQKQERSALRTLATIASASFERGLLLQHLRRRVRHTQILHDLGDSLSGRLDADGLVEHLNTLLRREGLELSGFAFRDKQMADYLGGCEETTSDREAWKTRRFVAKPDGDLCVPMKLGRRIVGSMRVRKQDLNAAERAFVGALAQGVAEVASRATLRAELEEGERERALAAERGRIAADLHDTAGQTFVAIGLLARRAADQLPADSPWQERIENLAELADGGRWDISRAIQSLAFFPEARGGIVPSLQSLVGSFEDDSGLAIVLDRVGEPVSLPAGTERALYRVAHGSLTNAWRHSGCSVIRLELRFEEEQVTLSVADDGLGLSMRNLNESSRLGLVSMRNAVREAGGTLRVTSRQPQGTLVRAVVPIEDP